MRPLGEMAAVRRRLIGNSALRRVLAAYLLTAVTGHPVACTAAATEAAPRAM